MASKRSTPLDDPPSASSDDEETEDDPEEEEEEEDESESEEEEEQSKPQNPLETPKFQNPSSKPAESSSEEELESESEEQTPPRLETSKTLTPKSSTVFDFDADSDVKSPTASDFAIKPSKKVSVGEKTPTSKRLFTGSDLKEKKKMKVSNGDFVVDDEKKSVVKRVWSDDDELLLLQGFIEYQSKKGCSPLSDMEGFYQFTMDSLPGNASKSQLYEKIRRLKKKFRVNSEKMSDTGEDPVFQKPHERKLFEVSKKIWGVDGCETIGALNANVKSNVKSKAKAKPKIEVKEVEEEEDDNEEEVDGNAVANNQGFETLYPFLSAGLNLDVSSSLNFPSGVVHLIKEKLSLIGEAKARELNEKWKAYFDNEIVLRKRRIALLSNVAALGTSVGK